MALQLVKTTEFGIEAAYWRIGVANIHPRTPSIQIVLDGYVSAQAFQQNAMPISRVEASLPYSVELADGGRSGLYAAIKVLPEWVQAEDA